MHTPGDVQYAIIGDYDKNGVGCCVGEFASYKDSACDLLYSLTGWAHSRKSLNQSMVLFINNLQDIDRMDFDVNQTFKWLLLKGPSRRVWPIVVMRDSDAQDLEHWLDAFHTIIYELDNGNFSMDEKGVPLEFWLPEVWHG